MVDDRNTRATTAAGSPAAFFAFFNEIGIISQLSSALLNARLPDGLLVAHFSVLNHLIRVRDGQTPMALASAFQTPKTTMTHTLAALEARGFVEMRRNPGDGRSKLVWLTAAGRAFRDDAIRRMTQDFGRLAHQIDPAAIEALTPALAAVRKALDADRE